MASLTDEHSGEKPDFLPEREDDLSEADDIMDDTCKEYELFPEDLVANDNGGSSQLTPDLRASDSTSLHSSAGQDLEGSGLEDNRVVIPNTDKGEVMKSIQKGKNELIKSRRKSHAIKGSGDEGADHAILKKSSSSSVSRRLPPKNHSTGTRVKHLKSSRTDPINSSDSVSSMGEGSVQGAGKSAIFSKRFSTTRKVSEDGGKKAHSQAGSLATPRKKGGKKKMSLEDMAGAKNGGGDMPAFCTPRRLPSSLQVDAGDMFLDSDPMGSGGEEGGPTKKTPKRTQSLQSQWRTSKAAYMLNQKKNAASNSSSAHDPGDNSTRSGTWDELNQSSVSNATVRMSNSSTVPAVQKDSTNPGIPQEGAPEFSSTAEVVAETDPKKIEDDAPAGNENSYCSEVNGEDTIVTPIGNSNQEQKPAENTTDMITSMSKVLAVNGPEFPVSGVAGESQSELASEETLHNLEQQPERDYWSCWSCEHDGNPMPHVFCGMCGASRDWICPSCQHENKSSFNFCGMDGTRKGNQILHKEQPNGGFDMRIVPRKKTSNNRRPPPRQLSRDSTSGRGSIRGGAPPSPTRSVATAKSTSRRSRHRLPSDENGELLSDSKSGLRSGENGSIREKKSLRGRGRGREEGKESKENRESKSGEGKPRPKRVPTRSRSSSRPANERGRENRKSRDYNEREGDRKPTRQKRKGEKVRRTRDATSVPAGNRRSVLGNTEDVIRAHAERNQIHLSGSLSALHSGPPENGNTNSSGNAGGNAGGKGKSWVTQSLTTTRMPSEELQATLNDEFNKNAAWNAADQGQPSGALDILATPSIKKRLLKMGGKVKGVGGMLFKGPDMPGLHDAGNEATAAETVSLSRASSSDTLDKPARVSQEGSAVPETPSLKKRLLNMKPWGKSEHGKPAAVPLVLDNPFQDETEEAEDVTGESESIQDEAHEDALDSIRTELVVTAKDVRPNRPVVSRHPQRRKSGQGNLLGNRGGDRDRRTPASASDTRRRVRRTKSGESLSHRRKSTAKGARENSVDSDNSSTIGDNGGRGADTGRNGDALGHRASEAESVNSGDFDQ